MDDLLDIVRARKTLGISEPTLYRLIRSGALPVVKIGDRNLFRPQDIEAFVERHLQTRERS